MLSTVTIGNIKQEIACMPSAASQLRLLALWHYLCPFDKGPKAQRLPLLGGKNEMGALIFGPLRGAVLDPT